MEQPTPNELAELRQRILELQGMLVLSVAQVQALKELAMLIWESQGIQIHETDPMETVFHRMELEHREILLSTFADSNPNGAATLKRYIDQLLTKKKA
jgi:hypothetical protein